MSKRHWQQHSSREQRPQKDEDRDMPAEHHQKRWYDHIANVTHAVYLSKQLPVSIQDMIARNLNEYIDTYRVLAKKDKSTTSLGSNRILGLYKAKYGHRWYDPNAKLGRAFNMMATIPEHFVEEYAGRIILVAHYVLQKQQQQKVPVTAHDMSDAVTTILGESYVSLQEGDSGIKLVPKGGRLDGHIVAVSESRENSPVLRHKKHR